MYSNLRQFITCLEQEREIVHVKATVDPNLEIAEIHRRVISQGGPALFFESVKGSRYPVVTNLFGTKKRVELAFGSAPQSIVRSAIALLTERFPPSLGALWEKRATLKSLFHLGTRRSRVAPVTEVAESARLSELPLLTSWPEDGGPFITLPLVYTEHPQTHIPNLGMYRIQRFDDATTGMHMQIGKGGGFHLSEAEKRNEPLPVTITIGGPPALILSAIAPLPENVSELLLASLLQGQRLATTKSGDSPLPIFAEGEFVLLGEVRPMERRLEGPFGDHYGYYSLAHDFPVFHCKKVLRRREPIYPATIVGKPRQEDFYLGNYLQELLAPLFPIVMPSVVDLWSYGETGYHSLTGAIVRERYSREALVSAFRILGEGQLSLTKFLLLTDCRVELKNFKNTLVAVLERADLRTDLYIFQNTSMDTLDYSGPELNKGSKGVLIGCGEIKRKLPTDFSGDLPAGFQAAVYCPGCLVISTVPYEVEKGVGSVVAKLVGLQGWPLIVVVDDVKRTLQSDEAFLWNVFTRFEPARDLISASQELVGNQIVRTGPLVIDARCKTWYPKEVECDLATEGLVDRRWAEYGLT